MDSHKGGAVLTDCQACANPEGGLYLTDCRACMLRLIARGPAFWESERAAKLTPAYRRQLAGLGVPAAVHQEVKKTAEGLRMVASKRMSERVTN